mmetsp:Transcript_48792/g.88184  ORF Transcript_48792/g.88184 Transcript_48792/m.88184 type:complete len:81 (+) Transcript_48792:1749-1991(+)
MELHHIFGWRQRLGKSPSAFKLATLSPGSSSTMELIGLRSLKIDCRKGFCDKPQGSIVQGCQGEAERRCARVMCLLAQRS